MEENKNIENTEEKISASDYKIILDMVNEVNSQYTVLKDTLENQMSTMYGLKPEILEKIIPYPIDEIELMSVKEMHDFISKYMIVENPKVKDYLDSDKVDELRDVLKLVKESSIVLYTTKTEADDIKKSSSEVLKEYFNYMNSDRLAKSREKRLESMKKALENETDLSKKYKMKHMIETMEYSLNFKFLSERFDKYGDLEVTKIVTDFFDSARSTYVKNKFFNKINKFGFKQDIYKYLFNIEEIFLPKKYSVYNNFFLFMYLRMVAYADPYSTRDKMFVQAFTGALSNLIYHKFDNLESEYSFIHIIMGILDKFEAYRDKFESDNITHENHPVRKEYEEEHEKVRKQELIKKMKDMKISSYTEDMSASELQEIYNRELDLMIRKQIKPEEEVTLEIDGSEEVCDVNCDTFTNESDSIDNSDEEDMGHVKTTDD